MISSKVLRCTPLRRSIHDFFNQLERCATFLWIQVDKSPFGSDCTFPMPSCCSHSSPYPVPKFMGLQVQPANSVAAKSARQTATFFRESYWVAHHPHHQTSFPSSNPSRASRATANPRTSVSSLQSTAAHCCSPIAAPSAHKHPPIPNTPTRAARPRTLLLT